MPTDCISFKESNYFSDLINDYLDQKEELKHFYNHFPSKENFSKQIEEKQLNYPIESRRILVESLNRQYKGLNMSEQTQKNITALGNENTFTITTGHQLNLFTGPLYFLYKIISTINLCKELRETYPNYNFVPIYWMASEDHDFEEINYFNFDGKKIKWDRASSGAVGELRLDGLDQVFEVFSNQLNSSKNATYLKKLFQNAYLENSNLADATRYLANELFSEYGLVIIDANSHELKSLFVPYMKKELLEQSSFQEVSKTNESINQLPKNYKIQVNPREINLFYIHGGIRERIVEQEGTYSVLETTISWDKEGILNELENYPERFSPNVILRPLYQEVILPNLCYIGGGGELAYWFQLKSNFDKNQVVFPVLLLRNSVLITNKKQRLKLDKLNLKIQNLFLKQSELKTKLTKELSEVDIDFSEQKQFLQKQFEELYKVAQQTDPSFIGAVGAQERKQIKGLEHLEKRLLKAQKRKWHDVLDRASNLQNELFPSQSLQERQANFSEFYLEYGDQLIQQLVLNLQPLSGEFLILNLD